MSTEKITRHSASAALDMQPDGVLVVRMAGPLTADALHHFKARIIERHGATVRAFVADYRGAAIALDGAALDAVLEGEPEGSAPTLPAAMVVRAEHLDLFIGHASRMALRGVFRRVEVAPEAAMAWARAQLHQQQRIQRH